MREYKIKLSIAALLSMFFGPTIGYTQWVQTNGPYGSNINCFATNGTAVFAGTNNGVVYRSTNYGASWVMASNSFGGSPLLGLAAIGTVLFAGTSDSVFRSTDSGSNWAEASAGLPSQTNINSIAVIGSNIFVASLEGLFQSSDSGKSWTNNGLGNVYPFIACGPILIASTIGNGSDGNVFVSTDSGVTWISGGNGLVNSSTGASDPSCFAGIGTYLFAGTDTGVYCSTNYGTSWALLSGLANTWVIGLAAANTILFAATLSGVFRSTDSGASWIAANSGLLDGTFQAFTSIGTNLFAGSRAGVFLSTNSGINWTIVSSGLVGNPTLTLAADGTTIFAGTEGGGAFLTTDRGNTWLPANNGLASSIDYFFEQSSSDVQAFAVSGTNIFAGTSDGAFISADTGKSWNPIDSGLTSSDILALAVEGTNLFAGGESDAENDGGAFLSSDSGRSWNPVDNGLPQGDIEPDAVGAFCVSDANVFAISETGGFPPGYVYLTTDTGGIWITAFTGLPNTVAVTSLAISGENLYAGTYGDGIYLSQNNGEVWTATQDSLLNGELIECIVASDSLSLLIVGTGSKGIFLSTNHGESWVSFNTGLTDTVIESLLITDSFIYAGTYSSGVWRRPLSDFQNLSVITQLASPSSGVSITPNPSNGETTITFQNGGTTGMVNYEVFDVLGRVVYRSSLGTIEAGQTCRSSFNSSEIGIPNGMYHVRVELAGENITGQLVIER